MKTGSHLSRLCCTKVLCLELLASGYDDGKGTHVSLFLTLMKGPHDDNLQQLGHWPLTGTFNVEVLNNFTDNNHFTYQVIFSAYKCSECTKRVITDNENDGWGGTQFISHHMIQKSSCNKRLYFNISYTDTNPVIPCNQIAPVTLRMHDVSEKMKNKEKWYSSPFYAFKGGYQMCLKVYTAGFGTGKGSHLSVYIHLMKGPNDDELQQSGQWPLRGVFNIKLLDQFSDNHHQRNVKFAAHKVEDCNKRVVKGDINVGCGIDKFLSLDDTSDYCNKNNFYDFEVSYEDVNPPNPDPPDSAQESYSFGAKESYSFGANILYILCYIVIFILYVLCYIVICIIYALCYIVTFIFCVLCYIVICIIYALCYIVKFIFYVLCYIVICIIYGLYYVVVATFYILYFLIGAILIIFAVVAYFIYYIIFLL